MADTSKVPTGGKVTYSVYEGIANVPTIKHNGGAAGAVTVFKANSDSNATVVFIEKNNKMTMASENKDVIYVKGSTVGTSYNTELGSFYEYDAFVNGEATTVKVDTTQRMQTATLVYGPHYNDKGILVGYDAMVRAGDANLGVAAISSDGSLTFTNVGTDSVVNDVIKLGSTHYAYNKDVNVYYITVDGELVKTDITAISEDSNDQAFFKVDDKGLLTDVYVRVVDTPETVNPGTDYNMTSKVVRKTGDGSSFAVTFTTANALSATDKIKVTITKKNASEGDALVGTSAMITATAATTQNVNTGIAFATAGNYVAEITVYNASGEVIASGTTAVTYVA